MLHSPLLTVAALFDSLLADVPHTKHWLKRHFATASSLGAAAGLISIQTYARGHVDPGHVSRSPAEAVWQRLRGKVCCVGVLCDGDGTATAVPVVLVCCTDAVRAVSRIGSNWNTNRGTTDKAPTAAAAHVI